MADTVEMTHPDLPDAPPAQVTRQAYELTWKAIGWKLVKPSKKASQEN